MPEKQTLIRKWAGWLLVLLALVRIGSIATDGLLVAEKPTNAAHASAATDDAHDMPVLKAAIDAEVVVPLLPVLAPVLLVVLVVQCLLLRVVELPRSSVPRFSLSYFRNLFPHVITAQAP